MRPLTNQELEQRLASIEPATRLRPPADLLAAIRSEIPAELARVHPANDAASGGGEAGAAWWRRHRLALAAAFVVVAATGLLSVRLTRLASPERLLAPAALESVASTGERADAPAPADQPIAGAKPDATRDGDALASPESEQLAERLRRVPAGQPPSAPAGRSAAGEERSSRDARPEEVGTATTAERRGQLEAPARVVARVNEADDGSRLPEPEAGRSEGLADTREATREAEAAREVKAAREATAAGSPSAEFQVRNDLQISRVAAGARASNGAARERAFAPPPPRTAPRPAATRERDATTSKLEPPQGVPVSESELRALGYVTPPAPPTATSADPAAVAGAATADANRDARRRVHLTTPPDLDASFDAMQFRPAPTNPFVDPAEDPLSTFGLDVDTGAYTLARRYLDLDRLPPSESVRVEEYVNFFDYGDEPPRNGDLAIRLEAGPSAFAPDGSERLMLRVGIRARDVAERDRKPAALIFLVDVSGSMRRENRLELVKRSLELLTFELGPEDSIGLVVYGSTGRALLEPTRDHDAIRQAIARLVPEGSTNLEDGLQIAYEMASRVRPGASSSELVRRVILCSDGVANVGVTDPEALLRGVADWAVRGVELTTVGFGMGNYNDELMERLADRGDGAYAYVDSLREARRIFVENLTGTLQTVAADARVQVELDPEVVTSYRLLGYANRAIPDAAFRDERVDAGEIGAGHRVSALYELELARGASRSGVLAVARLRWRSKESGRTEETTQSIAVREALRSWSATPASLRLAQVVAGFAEHLGRSPHTAATLDGLFREGQTVLGEYPGRLDVARLVTEIGEARDLEVLGRR
jgi:Ca-activated chloride channel family protein